MGIVSRMLTLAFPKGRLWKLIGDAQKLIDGISIQFQITKDLIDNAKIESFPGTAVETLPEWHDALGVHYDKTLPIEKQQKMLAGIKTATGSSTLNGLAYQVAKEYQGLTITERPGGDPMAYEVTGTVDTVQDARRVGAILAHFAPLHLVPTVFGYTAPTAGNPNPIPSNPTGSEILSSQAFARVGIAACGLARCGKVS